MQVEKWGDRQRLIGFTAALVLGNALSAPADTKPDALTSYDRYVIADRASVFEQPDEKSAIKGYLNKCQSLTFHVKQGQDITQKGEWLYYKGLYSEAGRPAGWIRNRELIGPERFKPVKEWPIRFLIIDTGFWLEKYWFTPSGGVQFFTENDTERSKPLKFQVFLFDTIAALGTFKEGAGGAIGCYDQQYKHLCPPGYSFQECKKQIDAGTFAFNLVAQQWYQGLFSDTKPIYDEIGRCLVNCPKKAKNRLQK
ncbi:MAG TPA: hypothetical protein VEL77_11850 [Rugosimonospora sp.]|nr:hypothetical protein [Rugosimonospora sp.]